MYKAVLPLYWNQINEDIFNTKIKAKQKKFLNFKIKDIL